MHATFRGLDPGEVERAVAALCELDAAVLVAGGRFSGVLATHLAAYLQILRPGVDEVPPEPGRRARALLSVDAATVLVVFDYRRHQPDTVEFGRHARARGARVVLVCDPFLSPLAPDADVLLTTSVVGPPPFDSAAGGLMLVEMLIGAVAERLGTSARERLTDFELHANGADPAAVAPDRIDHPRPARPRPRPRRTPPRLTAVCIVTDFRPCCNLRNLTDVSRLDELVRPERVHRSLYTDRDVFAQEMERVFGGTWTYLAHESEIPQPNDFVRRRLGLRPVVVTRDRNGQVHGLLNRCTHRGATVCRVDAGNAPRFVCPYHNWTFDNTGKLVGVPLRRGYGPGFDPSALDLGRLRVESYRGFVFGALDAALPPLEEHLGHAARLIDQWLDRWPGGRIVVRHGSHRLDLPRQLEARAWTTPPTATTPASPTPRCCGCARTATAAGWTCSGPSATSTPACRPSPTSATATPSSTSGPRSTRTGRSRRRCPASSPTRRSCASAWATRRRPRRWRSPSGRG